MSFTKACCSTQPVHSDYSPTGSEIKLGDLTVYETPDKSPKRILIHAYDIFGLHPNAKQFADIVGKAGFRVVIPDFFRGCPWDENNFPPKDMQDLYTWVYDKGSWETVVKTDFLNVINHYKKKGITSFGIYRFCYGAKMATLASIQIPGIKCVGLIHSSVTDNEEGNQVQCPTLLLPSKDEPDLIPFANNVKTRFGEEAALHVRFEDMHHGFAAGRGDFKNELNRKRVDDAINILVKFFDRHVLF